MRACGHSASPVQPVAGSGLFGHVSAYQEQSRLSLGSYVAAPRMTEELKENWSEASAIDVLGRFDGVQKTAYRCEERGNIRYIRTPTTKFKRRAKPNWPRLYG